MASPPMRRNAGNAILYSHYYNFTAKHGQSLCNELAVHAKHGRSHMGRAFRGNRLNAMVI